MHKKLITALTLSAMALPLVNTSTVNAVTGSPKESTATLKVTKIDDTDNALVLVNVPNFDFGSVPASKILAGDTLTSLTETDLNRLLTINDQRQEPGAWTLAVKGSPLKSANNTISDAKLSISGGITISDITLSDPSSDVTGNGNNSFNSELSGSLIIGANPNFNLTEGENFSSTLTWTLSAGTTRAPGL